MQAQKDRDAHEGRMHATCSAIFFGTELCSPSQSRPLHPIFDIHANSHPGLPSLSVAIHPCVRQAMTNVAPLIKRLTPPLL
ncbi:MAG: hypothetical protein B7Z37_30730 [Verrucomicrobia bacterium 12-59-8]|nr:MAG: hypothetical protein B7Z37_30730 [Verrucomicrobia bacterium 12-59-8]